MFTVTVRNRHGEKIARQIVVDDGQTTIAEVVEEARHQSRLEYLLDQWHRVHGSRSIADWWLMKRPLVKPSPPEPIEFDTLVNNHGV